IEALRQVAERKPHLKCGVLYNRRCSKAYRKVKEIIDHGGIGSLKRVNWMITNLYRTDAYFKSSAWRGTYKGEGGGLLMTQASHQLDLLQWLCGMPHTINGFCYNGINREIEVENDVTLLMEFENDATGQFIASSVEFPGTNRLELIGDKGQLILTNDEHLIYHKLQMSESAFNQRNGELFGQIPYKTETFDFGVEDNKIQHAALINQFIEAIIQDQEVICPLSQAIHSLTLIQACYLSSWSRQAVNLPLDTDLFMKRLKEKM
ncbi:MAG: Gfo/Idh/MocA family protein, partial [Turicibacter sp.]